MKKIFITLNLIFFALIVNCQIVVKEVGNTSTNKNVNKEITPYDSLSGIIVQENFSEYYKYVGQKLYLPEVSGIFLTTKNPKLYSANSNNILRPYNLGGNYDYIATFVYNPHINAQVTIYGSDFKIYSHNSECFNKYYMIIDIISDAKKYLEELKIENHNFNEKVLKIYETGKSTKDRFYISGKPGISGSEFEEKTFPIFVLKSDKGDTIYCSNPKPFIIVGNFEKMQDLYINSVFINQKNSFTTVNIDNKSQISVEKGSKWTCNEVAIMDQIDKYDPKGKSIYLILKNNKEEKIAVNIKYFIGVIPESLKRWILDIQYAEKLKKIEQEKIAVQLKKEKELEEYKIRLQEEQELKEKENARYKSVCIMKYGQEFGTLVYEKKIVIGMTKEMCKDAWGNPTSINKTTDASGVTEVWIYDNSFFTFLSSTNSLVFINDKLVQINEQL